MRILTANLKFQDIRYFTIILLALITTHATGQVVLFNKPYIKPGGGWSSAVIERNDGNYLIAGSTQDSNGEDSDINLLLVDPIGNLIWDKAIGQTQLFELAISLIETSDHNYLLSGTIWPNNFSYLLLFDSDGNPIWEKQYPMGETDDGNFFFVESGEVIYLNSADLYTKLYNVLGTGEPNWTKEYDFANCRSVIQTMDNGYALTGLTYDSIYPYFDSDIILIKTNSVGDTLWTRRYEHEEYSNAYSVQQTPDAGYIIAGLYETLDMEYPRASLIKTDAAGDTLWAKKYDSLGSPSYIAACEHSNGYIMSSWQKIQGPFLEPDTFYMAITKLDTDGSIEWSREFDGHLTGIGNNVVETSDGGFLLTGTSVAPSYPPYAPENIILIKLDSLGGHVLSTVLLDGGKPFQVSVYPNPASEVLTFKLGENDKGINEIRIFNINGQKVKDLRTHITNEIQVGINDLSNGMYFYEVTSSGKERFSGKFVVDK